MHVTHTQMEVDTVKEAHTAYNHIYKLGVVSFDIFGDMETKLHHGMRILHAVIQLFVFQCPRHQIIFPVSIHMTGKPKGLVQLQQISFYNLELYRFLFFINCFYYFFSNLLLPICIFSYL